MSFPAASTILIWRGKPSLMVSFDCAQFHLHLTKRTSTEECFSCGFGFGQCSIAQLSITYIYFKGSMIGDFTEMVDSQSWKYGSLRNCLLRQSLINHVDVYKSTGWWRNSRKGKSVRHSLNLLGSSTKNTSPSRGFVFHLGFMQVGVKHYHSVVSCFVVSG